MPLSLRSLTFAELPLSVCSFGRSFVEGVMNTVLMRPRALRALALWVLERTSRPSARFFTESHALRRPSHGCSTNRRELR